MMLMNDLESTLTYAEREWRRQHPWRYRLQLLGIAAACAWCWWVALQALVGFLSE